MKFYCGLLALLLIVAANNYTRLAIATMHEEVRIRVMMFKHLHHSPAGKLEPQVDLGTGNDEEAKPTL